LFAIATAALTGGTHERAAEMMPDMPLPLRARTFLLSLRGAAFESPAALLHGLEDAAETPAAVSKATRGVHVALLGAFPLGCAVIAIGAILLVNARKTDFSERLKLDALLDELRSADKSLAKHPDVQVQRKRDDIEIYLAEHMVRVIDDPGTWEDKTVKIGFAGARERARAAVERHPVRSAEEVRGADLTAAPLLEDEGNKLGKLANVRGLTAIFLATVGGTFIAVGVFAAIGALVTGSGFTFRMFGMALVNRRGRKISRVRALWRAAVTWSPIFAVAVALKRGPDITKAGPSVIALQFALLGVLAAAAVWAWLHPSRGIQDRLAGSWIVPR
jgi:hypothetical protein